MRSLITIASVLIAFEAFASAQLSVSSGRLTPRAGAVLDVTFSTAGVSALQFDVSFDDSVLQLETVAAGAIRRSSKDLYVTLGVGRQRIVIAGLNTSEIPQGPLVTLFVSSLSASATGDFPISFSNVTAVAADSSEVPLAVTDGAVSIDSGASTTLTPDNVRNAASLLAGPVAPGEIVTVFGSGFLPEQDVLLQEADVLFDGKSAPLLSIQPNRIATVVPAGTNQPQTVLTIRHRGEERASITLPVASAALGLFTINWTGAGQAAALNEDGGVNSRDSRARGGTILYVFATGLGSTGTTPTIVIGQKPCAVTYVAETEPGAGVWLIGAQLPEDISGGDAQPIELKVGELSAQSGVTVAVR